MPLSTLSPEELYCYEWQHNMLGGFMHYLAETIARSDPENRLKLREEYPVEVTGVDLFQNCPGWWEEVVRKVEDCWLPNHSS